MSETVAPSLYTYRAHVTAAYDGDSITCDIDLGFGVILKKQKIRLLDINAPEIRGDSREAGLASRDALRDRILDKQVTLRTKKDRKGKYGRWLGEIWLDDECINRWMLTEGHAVPYG